MKSPRRFTRRCTPRRRNFVDFRNTALVIGEACLVYCKHAETDTIRIVIGVLVLIVAFLKVFKKISDNRKSNDTSIVLRNQNQQIPDGIQVPDEAAETEDYKEPPYLIIWALFIGILSGFLGGLLGAKGPPLIIFFLIFRTPKGIIRTTGMATTSCVIY